MLQTIFDFLRIMPASVGSFFGANPWACLSHSDSQNQKRDSCRLYKQTYTESSPFSSMRVSTCDLHAVQRHWKLYLQLDLDFRIRYAGSMHNGVGFAGSK